MFSSQQTVHTLEVLHSLALFIMVLQIWKFCEHSIFANSGITYICDVKNSRQGRDLPISVNVRVISSTC